MENLEVLKDRDPIEILNNWLQLAQKESGLKEPWAVVLSTNYGYYPRVLTSRVILLKEIEQEKLFFYTNYKSAKSKQLIFIPYSSLTFYWPSLGRQIRLSGKTKKTNREQALRYWKTRSRESQISQHISKQSQPLESRQVLEQKWQEAKKQYENQEIPCPKHWGGFCFTPHLIEFWLEKPHRLHERLLFKRRFKKWKSTLLYP